MLTKEKRQLILSLHEKGKKNTEISDLTGVSRPTVIKAIKEAENYIVCANCGKKFQPKRNWQRFCCKKCSDAWWNNKRRKNGSNYYSAKQCLHCGRLFFPVNRKQKYCCRECYLNEVGKDE